MIRQLHGKSHTQNQRPDCLNSYGKVDGVLSIDGPLTSSPTASGMPDQVSFKAFSECLDPSHSSNQHESRRAFWDAGSVLTIALKDLGIDLSPDFYLANCAS